eukprot:764467-Hanusia_phi.AAC.3
MLLLPRSNPSSLSALVLSLPPLLHPGMPLALLALSFLSAREISLIVSQLEIQEETKKPKEEAVKPKEDGDKTTGSDVPLAKLRALEANKEQWGIGAEDEGKDSEVRLPCPCVPSPYPAAEALGLRQSVQCLKLFRKMNESYLILPLTPSHRHCSPLAHGRCTVAMKYQNQCFTPQVPQSSLHSDSSTVPTQLPDLSLIPGLTVSDVIRTVVTTGSRFVHPPPAVSRSSDHGMVPSFYQTCLLRQRRLEPLSD